MSNIYEEFENKTREEIIEWLETDDLEDAIDIIIHRLRKASELKMKAFGVSFSYILKTGMLADMRREGYDVYLPPPKFTNSSSMVAYSEYANSLPLAPMTAEEIEECNKTDVVFINSETGEPFLIEDGE